MLDEERVVPLEHFDVVDGQQRLTTCTLLLDGVHDHPEALHDDVRAARRRLAAQSSRAQAAQTADLRSRLTTRSAASLTSLPARWSRSRPSARLPAPAARKSRSRRARG
jgi:hypothetical protein